MLRDTKGQMPKITSGVFVCVWLGGGGVGTLCLLVSGFTFVVSNLASRQIAGSSDCRADRTAGSDTTSTAASCSNIHSRWQKGAVNDCYAGSICAVLASIETGCCIVTEVIILHCDRSPPTYGSLAMDEMSEGPMMALAIIL
jgi:hypothetical protein